MCGALLALGKGFLAAATVVPDSSGWSQCRDRLGEAGREFFLTKVDFQQYFWMYQSTKIIM